jgi:hypothetical protein
LRGPRNDDAGTLDEHKAGKIHLFHAAQGRRACPTFHISLASRHGRKARLNSHRHPLDLEVCDSALPLDGVHHQFAKIDREADRLVLFIYE